MFKHHIQVLGKMREKKKWPSHLRLLQSQHHNQQHWKAKQLRLHYYSIPHPLSMVTIVERYKKDWSETFSSFSHMTMYYYYSLQISFTKQAYLHKTNIQSHIHTHTHTHTTSPNTYFCVRTWEENNAHTCLQKISWNSFTRLCFWPYLLMYLFIQTPLPLNLKQRWNKNIIFLWNKIFNKFKNCISFDEKR